MRVCFVALPSVGTAERKDEGVRTMVAECLGRLALIDAKKIVPQMETLVKSGLHALRMVA